MVAGTKTKYKGMVIIEYEKFFYARASFSNIGVG